MLRWLFLTVLICIAPVSAINAQDKTWFTDITTEVGLDSIANYFMYVADINNDRYPDMVLQAGVQQPNQLKLFINTKKSGSTEKHERIFVDATAASGINGTGLIADLAALADVNNDGNIDLITAIYHYDKTADCTPIPDNGARCEVFLGDGAGHFAIKSNNGLHELGVVPGSSLSLLDYDRDGNIDVFIGTHFSSWCGVPFQNFLLKGNGDGTFKDVSHSTGIDNPKLALFGSNVGDWNNDCQQDRFASEYSGTGNGNLWKNNGDGTFTDVGASIGFNPHWTGGDNGQAMVPWAAEPYDYDNDGDMDILFVLVHGGADVTEGRTTMFNNQGAAGGYKLIPDLARITRKYPQSSHHGDNQGRFMDFDNDGLSDLVLTEAVYIPATDRLYFLLQDSAHHFNDITSNLGFITSLSPLSINKTIRSPHAIEPIDFDLDGDDDLMVGKFPDNKNFLLLRNDIGNKNNWSSIQLVAPEGVNKSCIGARITLTTTGGTKLMRDIYAGQGNFGAQQPFILTFGLGSDEILSIDVRWPNAGCSHTLVGNAPANKMLQIDKDGLVEEIPYKTQPYIYPNPVVNSFHIQGKDEFEGKIEIYNMMGQLVGEGSITKGQLVSQEIAMYGQADGAYCARLINALTKNTSILTFVKFGSL